MSFFGHIIIGLLALAATIQQAHADHIVIGKFRDSFFAPFIQPLIKDAYHALGHEADFMDLPPKRSIVMANKGKIDGELLRADSISNSYPNLVVIPVPVSHTRIVAATWHQELRAESLEDLAHLEVGYVNGQIFIEKHGKGNPLVPHNSFVELYEAAHRQLVTAILLPHHNARQLMLDAGDANTLRILQPDMARLDLYHVLHKKHQALIDRLTSQLAQMEKDGVIAWHNTVLRNKIYR